MGLITIYKQQWPNVPIVLTDILKILTQTLNRCLTLIS